MTYGTLSDYLEVPKGTYNVQVKVAPSTASDPAALEATCASASARPPSPPSAP